MKVALCSYGEFDFKCPQYEDYVTFTNNLKKEYCEFHGDVDFLWGGDCIDRTRDLHFARLPMMIHALEKGYDWAVWMDCDAAPVNFAKDLSQWLSQKPQDKVIIENDVLGINSGVMAVPKSPRCIEWLKYLNSDEIYKEYINSRFFDQDAIADSLKEDRWADLRIEPENEFGFNHFENIYKWYAEAGLECPNRFRRGDFCLHIPGYADSYRRLRFKQEWEDLRGIHCPVCNAISKAYFSVPFDKASEDVVTDAGMRLNTPENDCIYYKCPGCGYIFSPLFAAYEPMLKKQIYDKRLKTLEPKFAGDEESQRLLKAMIPTMQRRGDRVLELGGLYPGFDKLVYEKGGLWADSVDLFSSEKTELPMNGVKYTAVLCLDVLERLVRPAMPFALSSVFLASHGQLIAKTPIYDADAESAMHLPTEWPCIAPRLGVCAVHSTTSLQILAARYGFNYRRGMSNGNLAVFEKMHDIEQ